MDAYRGFVMLLMMAEVLHLSRVSRALPENGLWRFLAYHQSHVEWIGCSLHDLIQPSFSFLVGVALPFSIASRRARGQSIGFLHLHAAWRAVVLLLLGVFLRSMDRPQTHWTFEDTLTQIGLGYFFLFVLGFRKPWEQWSALGILLFGYWLAFALYPLPGPGFDYAKVGVPNDWQHLMTGFLAHWNKNSNVAWAFDVAFLNLFPREKPFLFNGGGYATLSFIPTLGTMVLGLLAGQKIRSDVPWRGKLQWLAIAGVTGLLLGWVLQVTGVCPVVKRIWTPAWTLYSGGWCLLLLGLFYWVIDVRQFKGWAFPLVVIGMNSIAAYVIAHVCEHFISSALRTHLGSGIFSWMGRAYAPLALGSVILGIYWLVLFWMYRRKIFLRI